MRPAAPRWLRELTYRRVGGTALVLMYHRVADPERDPQSLAVSPARFDEQMAALSREYPVIPLVDLVRQLRSRRVPDGAVAITFDDGYADNLIHAAPVLSRYGVPATVFVSSGYVDARREYWWDEVERMVLSSTALPASLCLEAGEERFSAMLAGGEAPSGPEGATWTVGSTSTTWQHRLYEGLCEFIRPLERAQRDEALTQLRILTGTGDASRAENLPLDPLQLATLSKAGGISIGGHTLSHQVLAARSVPEQRDEVCLDRMRLTEILGEPPALFAYPFGSLEDYTDETVRLVRECGYMGACSNHEGVVKPWTDPYRIPRYAVRDWDADTLLDKVEGWFDEPR